MGGNAWKDKHGEFMAKAVAFVFVLLLLSPKSPPAVLRILLDVRITPIQT